MLNYTSQMAEKLAQVACMLDPRKDCPKTCLLYDESREIALFHATATGTDPNDNLSKFRSDLKADPYAEDFIRERATVLTNSGKIDYCQLQQKPGSFGTTIR